MGDDKPSSSKLSPLELGDLDETGEAIDARAQIVAIAEAEIGLQDPDKYWQLVCPQLMGNPHKVAWCGGFALWCLRQAGLTDWSWQVWSGPGTPSGFLYHLLPTRHPKPGDMAYFFANQHHAIVKAYHGDSVDTIDGNSVPYPQEGVSVKTHLVKDVGCFYSIAQLIS